MTISIAPAQANPARSPNAASGIARAKPLLGCYLALARR